MSPASPPPRAAPAPVAAPPPPVPGDPAAGAGPAPAPRPPPGLVPDPMPEPTPELTVVVPCFNERRNVRPLLDRLERALAGRRWEAVFVDDDSPDGTAEAVRAAARADRRVRLLLRVGRRGLASAVIEGALSSVADVVAVVDGDGQHDIERLPDLLAALEAGAEVAVGSRYLEGGDSGGLDGGWRQRLSRAGTAVVQSTLPAPLTDPMSGMFALPQPLLRALAPRLTGQGFKILLDLLLSAPTPLRVTEAPVRFFPREQGQSKLDVQVLLQFLGLLLDKRLGGRVPLRFVSFAAVGLLGVVVNLLVLGAGRAAGLGFEPAQALGTLVAMAANFQLNNAVTYRDARLRGARLWRGLALFMLVCGIGAVANVGIAQVLHSSSAGWTAAGAVGAALGVVWNYAVSATLVWRR